MSTENVCISDSSGDELKEGPFKPKRKLETIDENHADVTVVDDDLDGDNHNDDDPLVVDSKPSLENGGNCEQSIASPNQPSSPLPKRAKIVLVKSDLENSPVLKKSQDLLNEFTSICKEIDKSEDMIKILQGKIEKHYTSARKDFIESQQFRNTLKEAVKQLRETPNNRFAVIFDMYKNLKANRSRPLQQETKNQDSTGSIKQDGDDTQTPSTSQAQDSKVDEAEAGRKIVILSRCLIKLRKKIGKLEEKEVDWETDNDSAYIQMQRYRERAYNVYKKLCNYTKEASNLNKYKKIVCCSTPFPEVNSCIEKFVNETQSFPDFQDILEVVRAADSSHNLKIKDVENIAKDAFLEVGDQLQRRRKHSDYETAFLSFDFSQDSDPAESDSALNGKLQENKRHWKNIQTVIDDFASRASSKDDTEENGDEEDEEDGESEKEEVHTPDEDDDTSTGKSSENPNSVKSIDLVSDADETNGGMD